MATKHNSSCLQKAGDDEPIFVLRAKDPTAPYIVRNWVRINEGIQPAVKLAGALLLADEMEAWHRENVGQYTGQIPS